MYKLFEDIEKYPVEGWIAGSWSYGIIGDHSSKATQMEKEEECHCHW